MIQDDQAASAAAPAGTELEIKFLAEDDAFRALLQSAEFGPPAPRTAARLRSVYFDTPDFALWRQGLTLRIRTRRGRHVMTLKGEGGEAGNPFLRQEREVASPSALPDPALFDAETQAELARILDGGALQPRFATDVRRVTRRLAAGASAVEIAFDSGSIIAGSARQKLQEIELELKSGQPGDLLAIALQMSAQSRLRLGMLSKSRRGMLLAGGAAVAAVRADPPARGAQIVDAVIGSILTACVRQFIGNWPGFAARCGPEPVHQMRVAMRRLRAALALFRRSFPGAEFDAFRAEASRIASAMGEARNWDVFAAMCADGPPDMPGVDALLQAAETHRQSGYAQVEAVLDDAATTRLVLSILAFVARRGWRNAVPGAELQEFLAPGAAFAATHLERLHRRVRKRGRHVLTLGVEDRHELRIALKNLRYAADFFAGLYDGAAGQRKYARAAAALQDVLGAFNDMAMVTGLVDRLDLGQDAAAIRAGGVVIGWYGHGAGGSAKGLRQAWAAFRKARPFWRDALPKAGA